MRELKSVHAFCVLDVLNEKAFFRSIALMLPFRTNTKVEIPSGGDKAETLSAILFAAIACLRFELGRSELGRREKISSNAALYRCHKSAKTARYASRNLAPLN